MKEKIMRTFLASVVMGIGALGTSAALPLPARADGPWHHHHHDYYNQFYAPGVNYVPQVYGSLGYSQGLFSAPVVQPAYIAPAYVPYNSFSFGYYGGGYGGHHGSWHGGHHGSWHGGHAHEWHGGHHGGGNHHHR
jgi:hypothetical protein